MILSSVAMVAVLGVGTFGVGVKIYREKKPQRESPWDVDELLTYAGASEQKQSHPIALAILQEANVRGLSLPNIDEAHVELGYGLKVRIEGHSIKIGSKRFMERIEVAIPTNILDIQKNCHEEGYWLVYIAMDGQLAGAIELHPTIRPEAKEIIAQLRQRQISLYIISGDHTTPTQKLAAELGIEHYMFLKGYND